MTVGYIDRPQDVGLLHGLWVHIGWLTRQRVHAHQCLGCAYIFVCTADGHKRYEVDACLWCTPWLITWRQVKRKPKPRRKARQKAKAAA